MRTRDGCRLSAHQLEALEARALLTYSITNTGPEILKRDDGITSSVVFDWDADGKRDLLVASGQEVLFLKGNGAGGFQSPRSLIRLANTVGLLALDPDSTPERFSLFAAQIDAPLSGNGSLRELVPNGAGGLRVRAKTLFTGHAVSITPIRDVSNRPVDLLLHTRERLGAGSDLKSRDTLLILHRNSAQKFELAGTPISSGDVVSRFGTPAAFDLDGDGLTEIVVSTVTGTLDDAVTSVRIYGLDARELTLRAETTDTGTVSQIVVSDVDGDGVQEAVFGRVRSYQSTGVYGRRWTQLVESVPILASGSGAGATFAFGMSRVLVDRTVGLSNEVNQTVDFRVIAVTDMNGDQTPDIVSTASYGYLATYLTTAVSRRFTLSQHSQRMDGSFSDAVIRSKASSLGDTRSIDWSFVDLSQAFAVVSVRNSARPDVLALDRPAQTGLYSSIPRDRTSLTLLRAMTSFGAPQVQTLNLQRVFTEITNYQGGGNRVYEGDVVRLTIDFRLPDATRFIGVQSVRLFIDSNANGRLDVDDVMLGTGREVAANAAGSPSAISTGLTRWAVRFTVRPWNVGSHTLFAQITDTRGTSSDPLAAAPVITVL